MVLAIALFVAGSKNYTHVAPTERWDPAEFCSVAAHCLMRMQGACAVAL